MPRGRKAGVRTEATGEDVQAKHRVVKQVGAYEIERGIPLPSRTNSRAEKYPYSHLEPGDSFFVADKQPKTFHSGISTRNKAGDAKYKAAASEKDGVSGVRVWRVK
ncbi:hypothetical protein GCM10007874_22170 [Labrys miyagiensis]|uniref:Uncharacterized protein n=1 Tax=Labrys miyagiensis TaxID=346912 RepID=A0ABQ6CH22_9HYPH|nr:hypothetical protein [Labrys miyagiensis]GLS19200.1 hypothetical protein GCM10007874_22170 [Labrys miyagiensis]